MSWTRRAATVAAALLIPLVLPGTAHAVSGGDGHSTDAPGQQRAGEQCTETVFRQVFGGVVAGGGRKAGTPAPTNCDQFWTP